MKGTLSAGEARGARSLVERLFAPIESQLWAALLARDFGRALVAVAVVQAALARFHNPLALLAAALYAVAGAWLWLTPTRLGAILALLTASASGTMTLVFLVGSVPPPGGRSILLDLVALWIAGRALVAAIAFRRFGRAGRTAQGDEHARTVAGAPPSRPV